MASVSYDKTGRPRSTIVVVGGLLVSNGVCDEQPCRKDGHRGDARVEAAGTSDAASAGRRRLWPLVFFFFRNR